MLLKSHAVKITFRYLREKEGRGEKSRKEEDGNIQFDKAVSAIYRE